MDISADLTGLKELDKALKELGADMGGKTLRSALMLAGTPLAKEMKARVPVRSGRLKKSIGKRSKLNKSGLSKNTALVRVGAVRKGAWLAQFQEFGTSKHRAQPFIRPAFESQKHEVINRFKAQLKRKILLAQKKSK